MQDNNLLSRMRNFEDNVHCRTSDLSLQVLEKLNK